MVHALVDITNEANRVLNIIKAKYGLKDKSEAINILAHEYAEEVLEPGYRPEYIEKLSRIEKEKRVKIKSFAKRYGLE